MKKILIVNSTYYSNISKGLFDSAYKQLKKYSGKKAFLKITTINTTGVFEIPVIIARNKKKYDAFIALGCVIKGQTPHFDFISTSVTNALMNLSISNKKPIGFSILTCLNKKQAVARMKKGKDAATAVYTVLSDNAK